MSYLVLVRHGESEWNLLGKWTGWTDVNLTQKGREDAKRAGESLKDIKFDLGYVATLKRAKQTLEEILKVIDQADLQITEAREVNERDYGDYTGKNKWEVKEEVGEEEFKKIRRGWDHPIPGGESLKQVSERAVPYFEANIMPELKEGKNIIVASSGNSLRTLVKKLEGLSEDEVSELEFGIGEAYVYTINNEGKVLNKEIRNKNELAGKQ